jgi:hypothetical protein
VVFTLQSEFFLICLCQRIALALFLIMTSSDMQFCCISKDIHVLHQLATAERQVTTMLRIQYSLLYPSLVCSDTVCLTTRASVLQVLAPHEWHHMEQEQCLKMTNSKQYYQTLADLHMVLFQVPHATRQVLHTPLGEGGFRSYRNWTFWQLAQDMHLAQTLLAPRGSMEPTFHIWK